jgi:hypothetical protein
MLDQGIISLQSPELKELNLTLVRSSQTVASLKATAAPTMDYKPGDRLKERSADSFYHLGDLDLRLRSENEKGWKDFSTAHERQPVRVTTGNNNGELLRSFNLSFTRLQHQLPLCIRPDHLNRREVATLIRVADPIVFSAFFETLI